MKYQLLVLILGTAFLMACGDAEDGTNEEAMLIDRDTIPVRDSNGVVNDEEAVEEDSTPTTGSESGETVALSERSLLVQDIDFDRRPDSIYIDDRTSTIVCRLSTRNYQRIESRPIEIMNDVSFVEETKDGFVFENLWMRAGYSNRFRYEKKSKRIRLIGMSRYELGNAANDGSGESSVNLLTGDYIGEWSYYVGEKDGVYVDTLIELPTIRTTMTFPGIYLEDFSEDTYFSFADRCSTLYEKHRELDFARR